MHVATHRCAHCKLLMCEEYATFHPKQRGCKDHVVRPMGETLMAGPSHLPIETHLVCPEHRDGFRLFDVVCRKLLCGGCAVHHWGHAAKPLNETRQDFETSLKSKVDEWSKNVKWIESRLREMSESKASAQSNGEEVKREIRRVFGEVRDRMDEMV